MAKKPTADVERIGSLRDLAKLVGRGKSTVERWVNNPEWTFGRSPWKRAMVPDILRWAAAHLRDRSDVAPVGGADPAGPSAAGDAPAGHAGAASAPDGRPAEGTIADLKQRKLAAEVRKLVAQANRAETALARERGQLLDAGEVEAKFAAVGIAIRSGFERLPSQLVSNAQTHGMPQASAVAFRRQVEAAVAAILRKLSGHGWDVEEDDGGDEGAAG